MSLINKGTIDGHLSELQFHLHPRRLTGDPIMRDSSDIKSPFELIPKTETPLEGDDNIPSFCKAMFTFGLVGGFLRIPVVLLLLLILSICLQAEVGFREWESVLSVLVIAAFGTVAMTCLGIGGNLALLDERRNAVCWGYGALVVAVLLYCFWMYVLGASLLISRATALISGHAVSPFAATLVLLLLVRLPFLIAYAVALHRYRQWLRWGWY